MALTVRRIRSDRLRRRGKLPRKRGYYIIGGSEPLLAALDLPANGEFNGPYWRC